MGLKDCQIFLDNPWNTYYPGQTINGRVDYTFDTPKKIRGIAIRFKGSAETSWNTTESRNNAEGKSVQTTVHHTGNEEYFSISYYLLGSKTGNEIELPPGQHTFPFTCALPPTLPSSFEGEFGFVRYTIKSTLDRPWKFDQETKMAFTVVSHFDLNMNPEYRNPVQIHLEKNFCCCWCKSGPLVLDVGIPVSGYCSGQVIPLDISCENGSNVSVTEIHIELRKVVIFRCQTPSQQIRESKIVIGEMKLGSVNANSSKNWKESLEIPPLPPSNLTNCSLIDLDYDLKVTCTPSGMHISMDDKVPIIIGTVPIMGFQEGPPQQPPAEGMPLQPPQVPGNMGGGQPIPGVTSPLLPTAPQIDPNYGSDANTNMPPVEPPMGGQVLYPALAQPVFREGQFAAKSIHDQGDHQHMMISGRSDFAPRYPTYGFVQPQ